MWYGRQLPGCQLFVLHTLLHPAPTARLRLLRRSSQRPRRLAALKEFAFMQALWDNGFPVPQVSLHHRLQILIAWRCGLVWNTLRSMAFVAVTVGRLLSKPLVCKLLPLPTPLRMILHCLSVLSACLVYSRTQRLHSRWPHLRASCPG